MTAHTHHHKRNPSLDPLTGEPGAHPLGVGIGATSGALAGATAGAVVAGPIGAITGAAIGAIAGAYIGKNAEETYDPVVETAHWEETFRSRPYCPPDASFADWEPAYRYGWESTSIHPDLTFEECLPLLRDGWPAASHGSTLTWEQALPATRDAWLRVSPDELEETETKQTTIPS